ncbi:MAG: YegP family protein, partial [Treponema sp.]|nr:YegP family protein [Treponema sp.]
GEAYPDRKSVLKGIASVRKNAAAAEIADETGEAVAPQKTARKPSGAGAAARKKNPKAKTA